MNKILPELSLSTRDKVLRYIQRVERFTIKSVAKKCKIRRETARYHIRQLETNLLVEQIVAVQSHSKLVEYRYCDRITLMSNYMPKDGEAAFIFEDLRDIAALLLTGEVARSEDLIDVKDSAEQLIRSMEIELSLLKDLVNCTDLWTVKTLVNRMGFNES